MSYHIPKKVIPHCLAPLKSKRCLGSKVEDGYGLVCSDTSNSLLDFDDTMTIFNDSNTQPGREALKLTMVGHEYVIQGNMSASKKNAEYACIQPSNKPMLATSQTRKHDSVHECHGNMHWCEQPKIRTFTIYHAVGNDTTPSVHRNEPVTGRRQGL